VKKITAFWKNDERPTIFQNFESIAERRKILKNLKREGWKIK